MMSDLTQKSFIQMIFLSYTLSLCYKNRSDFATSLRKLVLLVSVA